MKRTDRLTTFTALLLFLALLAYVTAYVVRAVSGVTVTAEAVAAEFSLSGTANGIVVREETLLKSTAPYVDVTAKDGAKTAAGAEVALAIGSREGLERLERIRALEAEVDRVSAALEGLRTAGDLTARDELLTRTSRALAAAVARHATEELDGTSALFRSLLLSVDTEQVSEGRLAALELELRGLRSQAAAEAVPLTAVSAGVFTSAVDGYEHLSRAALRDLTPSMLQSLIATRRDPDPDAYGKLVRDYHWCFAAAMPAADAAGLAEGGEAEVSFGRWYAAPVSATVLSIGAEEDGSVAVVFQCDTALAETLTMRNVSAEVVFGSYSGVRVPSPALQTDPETGETFVWTVTAMTLEKKSAEPLYEGDGFVILRRDSSSGALREGDTVVVSGRNLYEGKVMG